jgi:penicillin-binding protein 2
MFRRASAVYALFALFLGLLSVRILSVDMTFSREVSNLKSTRKLVLASSRGFIYDRNLEPLVNERVYLSNIKIGQRNEITSLCVDRYSDNQLCANLIGYITDAGKGVSGIERCYDGELNAFSGEEYIKYSSSATGEVIGMLPDVTNNGFLQKGGVVLTIDRDIQFAVERSMDTGNIDSGAAVVLDVKTGEVLASASRPAFNPNDISSALNSNNSPLLNRALCAYSVGSVFKPVIAAAALENGVSPEMKYVCNGSVKVGDTFFNCHKKDGHGELDLYQATAQSCNTYYINLTAGIDNEYLLGYLNLFNICSPLELADGLYTEAGLLPDINEMTDGEKANLSFGQGKLLASPVHLAAIYASIGNNGVYTPPILVKSMVDNNLVEYKKALPNASKRVMSERTAKIILTALEKTVTQGSGKNARSEIVSSAGKTATAQSGWYVDGREITHSWFIGLFPADEPKYVVCIIKENGKSGSADCAPVFRSIAELIVSYE